MQFPGTSPKQNSLLLEPPGQRMVGECNAPAARNRLMVAAPTENHSTEAGKPDADRPRLWRDAMA